VPREEESIAGLEVGHEARVGMKRLALQGLTRVESFLAEVGGIPSVERMNLGLAHLS
jgi:hypothetical protein